jgi:hypothetical protein
MKARMAVGALVVGMLGWTQPAHAADGVVYGYAAMSCGTWTALRNTDATGTTQAVLGFVSGATLAWSAPVNKTDADGMLAFVTQYCTANPLADLGTGLTALFVALMPSAPVVPAPATVVVPKVKA